VIEGKDLLCRARTGSGKTLCYAVPLVQRLLSTGSSNTLCGLVLVPSKELIVQVHQVINSLLSFCFDVLTVDCLLPGQKYMKSEMPSMLVTTPSSLLALLKQRKARMQPLAASLKILVVDEADLMFSFGYEEDMRALCGLMPATYQAVLVSATLSEEVEMLKGLMLHKPVTLKLEEPRITGKLNQFYVRCDKDDKYLIIYALLKLKLVQPKILMFVNTVEAAYKMKIFLERFSINSAVLNAEMTHHSRQNVIQAFNQDFVDLLIATDHGFRSSFATDDRPKAQENTAADREPEPAAEEPEPVAEEPEPVAEEPKKKKRKKAKRKAAEDVDGKENEKVEDDRKEAAVVVEAPGADQKHQKGVTRRTDEEFSVTRGVDLKGVSTVVNADVPVSVRDYTHRVGRCARGGASGTALTVGTHEEEEKLQTIVDSQASSTRLSPLNPLPLQMADVELFRYRVTDISRGLNRKTVAEYRARELQLEALKSEKLKSHFEDHPEDKMALQRAQRTLKERKGIRQHLKTIPYYLMPEDFHTMTPVQQAIKEVQGARPSNALKKRRRLQLKKPDVLHDFGKGSSALTGRKRFTRERAIAIDRRLDPAVTDPSRLPTLGGNRLWKLRHGKRVRRPNDTVGDRKGLSWGQSKRKRKFGF